MSLLLLLREAQGEAPSPDVVSRWELDETSGVTAVDSVGSNDGTYTSAELGKPSIIPYIPEAVTALLGENAYITVPDDESLHFNDGLSLRLWYEVVDTGVLFARDGNYTLSLSGEGKLTFAFRDPAGEWHEASTAEGALGVGRHSIEVTYDRSDIRIYIDGEEAGSAAATEELRGTEGDVWIGVQPGGEFQFCHGRYQRIELRSGPRSAAEILATYEEESVEKWLDFNGDFETGDFSQYWEVQANEDRATIVESPLDKGQYAAHFEVQEGDPEVVGPGGNRAEAIPDKFFWDGDTRYFRGLLNLLQVDWPHWAIVFQLHDESKGSPPVCGFLIEDEGSKRFRIQKGDSSAVYFDVPVVEGETFEWVLHVAFGLEGSLKLWINGELIGEVTGVDTSGTEPCNFKVGIYRSGESKGTTELLHDGVKITNEFPTEAGPVFTFRQSPTLGLDTEIQTPSGRFYRWGKDEPRSENIPSGHSFTTTMPGGFDQESVTLPRKPGVEYGDLGRLSNLRALGAGGEVACETRLERAPRTSGNEFSVGPESKGWIAHLEDDQSAAEIYRDIDLNGWGETSRDRAAERKKAQRLDGSTSVVSDAATGLPAVVIAIETVYQNGYGEALYNSTGIPIGSIYYDYTPQGIGAGWTAQLELHDDDSWASEYNAGTNHGSSAATATVEATAATRTAAVFIFGYTGGGGPFEVPATAYLRRPAVYGNHDLALQGTEPEAGFIASDVVTDALSRWAPLLRYSTGPTGTIRPSSFVIPHLSFKDKTTALAMIEGANRYELRNYAVWENRTFHYHDWGDRGRKWRTRVAPSQLQETGPTLERLRNGVIMQWQDVDGSTKTAGPLGSGCDVEDERLEDRDPENPANQLGIRMWGPPVDMGGVSVESEVVRVGALYLERLKETDTSGQMQLVGTVEDDRGIVRPAWQVRAGDTIVPVDASDTRERRIIRTSYSEETFTNTIDLDAPPDGTPDLLAQLGVSISDLGL